MKRLILFLVLFGSGLVALRLFQGSGTQAGGQQEVPDDLFSDGEPGGSKGFTPGGRVTWSSYLPGDGQGARPMRLEASAEDSGRTADGNSLYLLDVKLRFVDPETGELAMEMQAERGEIDQEDETQALKPRFARQLRLEVVEVTVHSGIPIVPVTLGVASLHVDLDARTLTSSDAVTVSGPMLSGVGEGFFFDEAASLLRLKQNGLLTFWPDTADEASLGSREALEISQEGAAEAEVIRIKAIGDARLAPPETGGGLDARTIELSGVEGPDGAFELQSLEAVGDVEYAHEGNLFAGQRANVAFHPGGEPQRALLGGDPRATISLQGARGVPGELAAGEVTIDSESPLDVRWDGPRVTFETDGPAVVEGGEAKLRSRTLSGFTEVGPTGARRAELVFDGSVRLEREGAVLVTRELVAQVETDRDGQPVLQATARGRPLLTGSGESGREFLLNADDLLTFTQRGEAWAVPEAEGVELVVYGEDGFRARADRVRNFDPQAMAMSASGGIQLENEQGEARGASLEVTSREHFVLHGDGDEPARFESPQGTVSARSLERTGPRVDFREDVVAEIRPEARSGELYDIQCDALAVTRRLLGTAAGEERVFDLEATGSVQGAIVGPEERVEFAGSRLTAHHVESVAEDGTVLSRSSRFDAEAVERAHMVHQGERRVAVRLTCNTLDGTRVAEIPSAGEPRVQGEVRARGRVIFHGSRGEDPFSGTADEVRLDHAGNVSILAEPDRRVFFSGVLPSNGRPFEMGATWVEASEDGLEAGEPDIQVSRMEAGVAGAADIDIRAQAKHLVSTDTWLEFREDVRVEGLTEKEGEIPWKLEADLARFEGSLGTAEESGEVNSMSASGNVVLTLPNRGLRATGDRVRAQTLSGLMRIEGTPARLDSTPLSYEAEWIELDVNLGFVVGSGRARASAGGAGPSPGGCLPSQELMGEDWSVSFLSSSTLVEPDALVYVLQEPRFRYTGERLAMFLPAVPTGEVEISSSWAILWIDRRGWDRLPERLDEIEAEAEAAAEEGSPAGAVSFWERVRTYDFLNEVYLEGPVEVRIQDRPGAFATAVYLDIVSGHGWLADANFTVDGEMIGREFRKIKVLARWLRLSEDDSFHADEATIALCEFDDPHVQITTGDLRISPRGDERFNIELRDNRIELHDLPAVPLPSIDYTADEDLKPDWASIQVGDSARFGSFVSAGIVRPANRVAELFDGIFSREKTEERDERGRKLVNADAEYSVDASWLGSRGVLLDFGLKVVDKERYWLTAELGGVPDSNDDKGYIRVPEDDRDTLRLWFRTHGRYFLERDEWLDVAGSIQTDAGVQSEFFESDFERYEQSESYLRWRKADGANYYAATVKPPSNEFFSDIDELPSVGAWRGRTEVLPLGPTALVYSGSATAAYLRRRESEEGYASPYGLPEVFDDGFGDREVLRFDTQHRVEAPIGLGLWGLRATPFALARFSAWDRDITEDEHPLRTLGQAGLRVSTTLWRRSEEGQLHQLVPYVEARGDVVLEESGGTPVAFDGVEAPVDGTFVDLGMRTRLAVDQGRGALDVDVRATHAEGVSGAAFEGWNEFGTFSRLSIEPGDIPVQVLHDGRYDFEEGDTLYSRVSVGFRPRDDLAFQASHLRGLDLDREALYEAASIAGLYTWTEKWEFEGRQTISLRDNDRLGSRIILRRYGHDLVFELESSFREGEGASFGISVRPLFTWDRPDIGFLDF